MTSLIRERGRVVGLKYENTRDGSAHEVRGSAVVLATGGFCYNVDMLKRYSPGNAHLSTTNGKWANGEGMLAASAIGAKLVDMSAVQIHPTGFIDPQDPKAREKTLAAECLRAAGGLLINQEGHRFTNELGHRDDVTSAERGQKGKIRLVMNSISVAEVAPHVRMYTKFFKVLKVYKNSYDLAKDMGIEVSNLIDTYNDYNERARKGWCPSGKPRFPGTPYSPDQELRVGFVEPLLHYVMGGIAIDTSARALDENKKVIPGLYVCGECAGGIHGKNRLAGNSLVDCVVYGRVAGNSTLKYASRRSKL
jgi:flavocytochrome c